MVHLTKTYSVNWFVEFEGEKIPHLVKKDVYKQSKEKEEEDKKVMDDYVLHKLFKKGEA